MGSLSFYLTETPKAKNEKIVLKISTSLSEAQTSLWQVNQEDRHNVNL